jgi:hypothetical protein
VNSFVWHQVPLSTFKGKSFLDLSAQFRQADRPVGLVVDTPILGWLLVNLMPPLGNAFRSLKMHFVAEMALHELALQSRGDQAMRAALYKELRRAKILKGSVEADRFLASYPTV